MNENIRIYVFITLLFLLKMGQRSVNRKNLMMLKPDFLNIINSESHLLVILRLYAELGIFDEALLFKLRSRYPRLGHEGQFEVLNYLQIQWEKNNFWSLFQESGFVALLRNQLS